VQSYTERFVPDRYSAERNHHPALIGLRLNNHFRSTALPDWSSREQTAQLRSGGEGTSTEFTWSRRNSLLHGTAQEFDQN